MRTVLHAILWASTAIALLLVAACNETLPESDAKPGEAAEGTWADSVAQASHMRTGSLADLKLRFHWEPVPWFDERIPGLKAEAAASLHRDLGVLGLSTLRDTVDILYFDAREDLRPLTGFAPKGMALPERNALLIATNDSIRAYHTHELMHIVSIREWDRAADPPDWIQEGLAMYADEPCNGYSMLELAAYHLHHGSLYPLDSLTGHFRELEDVRSYVQAGAFVRYLVERNGMSAFEALWSAGWAEAPSVLGAAHERIEDDYRAFLLQRSPRSPQVDWEMLREKGCG